MQGTPMVAVIMAVHNETDYLGAAIESVLEQTFGNFEFIIVDDDSKPLTKEILNSYADKRIKLLTNPANIGLTRCLSKAMTATRSKYIARMDADDISYPERFEKQVAFLEEHPDHAAVGTQCHYLDSLGRVRTPPGYHCSSERISEVLRAGSPFAHGSAMFVREYIMECGGYRELFRYAQDYDLWLRVIERYHVACLPEVLYSLRFHRASVTRRNYYLQFRFAELAREFAQMRSEKGVDPVMAGDIASAQAEIDSWHANGLLQRMRIKSDSALRLAVHWVYWARLSDVFAFWLTALWNNPLNREVWAFLFSETLKVRLQSMIRRKH